METSHPITLQKLYKAYHQQPVLNIPELKLNAGLYVLRGPNGAGKSTLMRILAGIVPAEGEIWLGDLALQKQPIVYRRYVAYAEAEPEFPEYITGRELLGFVCKARTFPLSLAEALCEKLGVNRYYRQPTSGYSSGMRKKLALVLALANECSWILLDEPFNALDEASCLLLKEMIQERFRKKGTAFLLSAHQRNILPEAEVLTLINGKLQKSPKLHAKLSD